MQTEQQLLASLCPGLCRFLLLPGMGWGYISLKAQHSSIISAIHFWRVSVPHHLPGSRPVPYPTCGWWGKAGLALRYSEKAYNVVTNCWLSTLHFVSQPLMIGSCSPAVLSAT